MRIYEDVREVTSEAIRPGIICGGFPCQDISNAGKREGIRGARSGLWFEYARVISELKPRYVFIENVAALVNRGLGEVLGSLAACGYDAEWDVFSAAETGAWHRRERLFILAYSDGYSEPAKPVDDEASRVPEISSATADANGDKLRVSEESRPRGPEVESTVDGNQRAVADANSPRLAIRGQQSVEQSPAKRSRLQDNPWTSEPGICPVAYGVSDRVAKLRLLGNAVVPQQAALAFQTLMARSAR